MNYRAKTTLAACVLLVMTACGDNGGSDDDENGKQTDTTSETMDTAQPDPDTSEPDPDTSQPDPDTSEPDPDTAPVDTGDEDTMSPPPDTADSGVDTGTDTAMDTGRDAADTAPADTKGDADATVGAMSVRQLRSTVSLQPGDSTSREYTVTDVIVTGIAADGANSGFFVQDKSGSPENSGLWVFAGNSTLAGSIPTINRGTVLEITGTVTNYDNQGSSSMGGLLELEEISKVNVLSQGASLPQPVQVSASDVALSGSDSETYEGVLVEVTGVEVANPPGNFTDTELTSGLYIGPDLYDYSQDFSPMSGTTYSSIVGPLNFSFDKTEISPREQSDITP